MRKLDILVTVLLIIGGLNWGLIGLFQFDLVAAIFGSQSAAASRIIYTLVGLSALYEAFGFRGMHERWCGFIGRHEPTRV